MTRHVELYRGPSRLDGSPIVVLALLAKPSSSNVKTGPMVQTYIIRADVDPQEALWSGADFAICGDCLHRGDGTGAGRTCYVNIGRGPMAAYAGFVDGKYARLEPREASAWIAGKRLRIGTYGDPGAVPTALWRRLARHAAGHTGYTHLWRNRPSLRPLVMASVDSEEEMQLAQAQGWRTFRVRAEWQDLTAQIELECPASAEAGHRTTCADCMLCSGDMADRSTSIPSVSITVHGGPPTLNSYRRRNPVSAA